MPRNAQKHDYNIRPTSHWEDGYFVPAAPIPVEKHPDDWTLLESVSSLRAMNHNPVATTTRVTRTQSVVKANMFGQTLIVACMPDIIRYMFVENGENYGLNSIRQNILRPILRDGLITAQGAQWKRARRALAPIFTPRHVNGFCPSMQKTAQIQSADLFDTTSDIDVSPALTQLTYAVLSETLFSGEILAKQDAVLQDVGVFLTALGRPNLLDVVRAPRIIPRLSNRKGQAAIKRLRGLVLDLVQDRKTRQAAGETLPDDFLTLLINTRDGDDPLDNAEIEDQIITFIGAGHETTARALGWTLYLLSQDTTARDRVEAEIDGLDRSTPSHEWAAALPFTMACFRESMRLYPPAPIISRYAIAADRFEDLDVPQGADILVNLWALHRHEKLWERPDSFNPDRFMGKRGASINRFAYLPFGMGHRVCIGQRFAMQEAAILLVEILSGRRFDYIGKVDPWPLMRITVQAEDGMPMRVTRRN